VLTALANDPARLHQPAPGLAASNATRNGTALEDLAGVEMSGVAGAIMVFERVIKVGAALKPCRHVRTMPAQALCDMLMRPTARRSWRSIWRNRRSRTGLC
jgi:hypothetical protein